MDITLNVESTDTFYDRWCKVYDSTNEPAGCDGGEEFGIVDYGNRGTPDVYLVKAYATGEWNSAHYVSEPLPCCRDGVPGVARPRRTARRRSATIQKIANEDVPYVIPYFYNSLFAYKKNVAGIVGQRSRPLLLRHGRLHRVADDCRSSCQLTTPNRSVAPPAVGVTAVSG